MRVLYLNPFSQEVSGPDESLRALLGGLIPLGVEAHVVIPSPGPQVPRYEARGASVEVAPVSVLRRHDSPAGHFLYPAQLARGFASVLGLARRLKIDLVHTNMEVILEGGLVARALRVPHVLHYRGNTLDRPRLVFDGLTAAWTALSDHIYCISEATAAVFARRGRTRKVEVLYNPIDVRAFAQTSRSQDVRAGLGAGPDDLLVGTVGRIHPRKDLETFVRAAGRVAAREPRARFVIVGAAEGPAELSYEARLRALAITEGVGERLRFAGARREIPDVMKALDIFALTSRHEGFGRVAAEAMAAGRPVVVTREGALPEVVDEGRSGLCANAEDADDFGEKVLRLLREPAVAQELAARAAERAWIFDTDQAAARVYARYRELALGSERRR